MRRPVFTDTDAVVREHIKCLDSHERSKPQSGLHVIGKDEERGTEGQHAAVGSHAVYSGSHGVLANPKSNVAATVTPHAADCALRRGAALLGRLKVTHVFESGVGGGVQVG